MDTHEEKILNLDTIVPCLQERLDLLLIPLPKLLRRTFTPFRNRLASIQKVLSDFHESTPRDH